MEVYLNRITGIDDAIVSMYMSKRTWTRKDEEYIRKMCEIVNDKNGHYQVYDESLNIGDKYWSDYNDQLYKLFKWTKSHITLGRFIDFSITVEGLHRAGQDDWDSHAQRFNNRIIRSSTRMANFDYELSDYYNDKIIPTDIALAEEHIQTPDYIERNGVRYVKTVNGYIRSDLKDDKDVKRGLYMLSIPSNFIFKSNLTEWAHVYKERNKDSNAHPEVRELCELIADQLEKFQPHFTRELFNQIKN